MLNWQFNVCFQGSRRVSGGLDNQNKSAHLEKYLLKLLSLEAQTRFDSLNYFVSLDSFS